MRVLLVDDDERLLAALSDVLRAHGMSVDRASTGNEALTRIDSETDAVVLDLTLPDRDGFDVCSRIRAGHDVPILMATARADLTSRVHGLNLGADDYLVKPYDVRELIARLHAVARRRQPTPTEQSQITVGDVEISVQGRRIAVGGREIALTRKEFDLLAVLARSPGVVFRREQIVSEVWQSTWKGCYRTLEVHVASVRAKTGSPQLIETVRGVGYRLGR